MLPERSWNTEDGKCETQSFILSWCTMNDSVYLSHLSDSVIHFECVKWKICVHKLIHPINVLIRIRKCSILFDQPLSLDQDFVFSLCLSQVSDLFLCEEDWLNGSFAASAHGREERGRRDESRKQKLFLTLHISQLQFDLQSHSREVLFVSLIIYIVSKEGIWSRCHRLGRGSRCQIIHQWISFY